MKAAGFGLVLFISAILFSFALTDVQSTGCANGSGKVLILLQVCFLEPCKLKNLWRAPTLFHEFCCFLYIRFPATSKIILIN